MRRQTVLAVAVLVHSASFFEGCAWVAGLGDAPSAEWSGDGGPNQPVDGASMNPIAADDAQDAGNSDLGLSNGPAVSEGDVAEVLSDRSADESATADSPADATAEPSLDSAVDSSLDAGPDSTADSSPHAGPDAAADSSPDAGPDAPADSSLDAGPDATADSSPDAGPDSTADSSLDAGPDALMVSPTPSPPQSPGLLNPGALPGLVLWLDATSGLSYVDGGAGSLTWADRSAQHNDAISVGTPAIHSSAIGGNPAIHFDGSSYLIVNDSPSLQLSTGAMFIALVTAQTTPADSGVGYGIFYAKQVQQSPYLGLTLNANSGVAPDVGAIWAQVVLQLGGYVETPEGDFNNGKPFYLTSYRSAPSDGSATLNVRVNGALAAANTGPAYAVDISAIGYPAYIGGTPGMQDLVGDIAELIVVRGPLSDSSVLGVESYLSNRYHL